jgi:PIN domain nuclease of toxin-antitoxin system
VWFWYLTGSSGLLESIRGAIDDAPDEVWISPISVWALGMLEERGRVRLSGGFRGWEAVGRFPLEEAPLNREVALVSHEIRLPHRDPADRFLAATALASD